MCLTVTKKARPKQSYDLNLKAWDNKTDLRVTVSAFVGFKDLWEIMDSHDQYVAPAPCFRLQGYPILLSACASRNEGGLFGGERTWA